MLLPTRSDSRHELVADAVREQHSRWRNWHRGTVWRCASPICGSPMCSRTPPHSGHPPNVVQTDPHSWLRLVTGLLSWEDAQQQNLLSASGSRSSEVSHWLPLCPFCPSFITEAKELMKTSATTPTTGTIGTMTSSWDDHGEQKPREECGVFAVWAPEEEVSKLTFYGLYALQHRGQEACGMAVGDGRQTIVFKDLGLVNQVFDEQALQSMRGKVAIGHTRYSTSGATTWENAQPMFQSIGDGTGIALAHNGNIVNTAQLQRRAVQLGISTNETLDACVSDTDLVTALLAKLANEASIEDAAMELLPRIQGAYCFVMCDSDTIYAARDPYGVRPLSLGRLQRGWVVASETCALDIVGASFVRDIKPGEFVTINETGVHSRKFSPEKAARCVFEHVYLARPDSFIDGQSVNAARVNIGRTLAKEHPADGDIVIPVPESGTPSAVG